MSSKPPSRPPTALTARPPTHPSSNQFLAPPKRHGSVVSRSHSARPQTAYSSRQSATSARPSTTGSIVGDGGEYIVAALQNKGTGVEVGLAAINIDTGRMTITQVADSSSFNKTLYYLSLYRPKTVLVTDTQVTRVSMGARKTDSKMVEKIEKEFQLKCEAVARSHWSADNGLDLIKQFGIEDDTKASVLMVAADRYYALCAASALLTYACVQHGANLSDNSVIIKYETMRGHMFIDPESARNLELVQNNITMKNTNTLFSTLNACTTPMGIRLLRSSILQPSNQKPIIENRLDAVEELVNSSEKLGGIRKSLKPVEGVDFDKLITSISQNQRVNHSDPVQTETRIALLLQLRKVVTSVPELARVLRQSKSTLLKIGCRMLSDPQVQDIATLIDQRINDEASLGTGKGTKRQMSKNSKLYAVKSNFNQLLDVARATHAENVADIMEMTKVYQDEYGITTQLEWSEQGYRFHCLPDDLVDIEMPKVFIHFEKSKKAIRFTSHELLKRNQRMLQTQQEVFLMSEDIVAELIEEVVDKIGCLYACSEAIALLDVLSGFADISSFRPQFGKALVIKNGRHPILDQTLPSGTCVPNDVYAADGPANFQLIQGPNMSGKSTYLRQIGLLTVQAMVGCFVPAEYAQFKLHDALLTRLSNDDSIEKSLSTFAAEMATSAMILGLATDRSLVLIDELGRGTAPIEGVGLSQAIAEALIRAKSFVFFATHFQELAQTLCIFPGVQTLHLQVQSNSHMGSSGSFSSVFHYKVVQGSCKEEHYGLELAKLASLPTEVTDKAWEVATKLTDLEEKGRNASLANAEAMRRKVIIELRGKLQQVLESSQSDPSVVDYLRKLQEDLFNSMQTVLEFRQESAASDDTEVATSR
ncbi:MutS protein msh4 [Apiotrichum porosum]|uniref:DNA mismatch repair protein MSH3 n=1 Tax=Apiotrichum porosum TaxID=105984 RepID=A0A427XW99_9TREE|nr:MutS protein msh4 [Apiotrichum porosum]RSH83103.1 MutS protein msh4 [Apiotrichum porosum]